MMKHLNKSPNIKEDPISKADQALLDYAGAILVEEAARELDRLEAEANAMDIDINPFVEAKNMGLAKLVLKKRKAKRRARIRRVASVVAIIVVALTLTFTGLSRYSIAFRNVVSNMFYDDGDKSLDLEVDNGATIPNNWQGCYAPVSVPYGFFIVDAQKGEFIQKIGYADNTGNFINFSVLTDRIGVTIDDEVDARETISINGNDGVWIQKTKEGETFNAIIWYVDDDVLKLYSNLPKDQLLGIAETVQIVQ